MVLDDPIQAMDPSKIDGFLQILTTLAESRQVIVLTHDDRLPAAIRRSRAPARIVELHRGLNSSVSVTESTRRPNAFWTTPTRLEPIMQYLMASKARRFPCCAAKR